MTTLTEMAREKLMRSARRLLLIASGLLAASPAWAQSLKLGVERLYVLECGHGPAPDQGRFSPGHNDGKPLDFVDNCYLIRHAQGYLLWGTGVADKFFGVPGGLPSIGGRPNWVRSNTLAGQLAQLGLGPSDIRYVGLTNSHIDHIGNLEMFPGATILVQRAEVDFAQTHPSEDTLNGVRINAAHPMAKIDGDHDVFGDGTVRLIATPSVTPGNQSLLVKLPKTGTVLLSGDVIHFQYGWDHRIVPSNVWESDKTLASFKRLADIMAETNAQLWIEHDKAQSDTRRFSPEYYE
jgi:N-acyl homoserine lactone hydrolase